MKLFLERRSPWIFVPACAVGFSGASLAIGYGWSIAVICAATGAIIGFRASRRQAVNLDQSNSSGFRHSSDPTGARDFAHAEEKSEQQNDTVLSRVIRPLKPCQKFAFLAFLAQATICFMLIVIGWLATKIGWTGSTVNPMLIDDIASKLFPIEAGNTQAQAMLNFLFVPLTIFYAVTMTGFVAAVFSSVGTLMRNIKSNWRLLILIIGIILFVLIMFYPTDSYQTAPRIKRLILDGNLFTYIAFFCFIPLFGMILSHALPEGE